MGRVLPEGIVSLCSPRVICVSYTDTDSAAGEGAPVSGAGGCVPDASRAAGTSAAAALPGRKKQFQACVKGMQ